MKLYAYSFLMSVVLLVACNPKKNTSSSEEDTLSNVVTTPNENEVEKTVEESSIDTLNGFYQGEYVAANQGEDSWYLAKIVAFEGTQANLLYTDGDTNTKDFAELVKLDTIELQKKDKVWALFGDAIRFKRGIIDSIEEDSVLVKFEGFNDAKVHVLRVFKTDK